MEKTEQVVRQPIKTAAAPPLVVDLDGTLLKTDLLHEAILHSLKHDPLRLVKAARAIWRGRAAFKNILCQGELPDPQFLPLREEVLDLIAERRAAGCPIVLATASPSRWAQTVADEVSVFDTVLASDAERNLKGAEKLTAIRAYCRERRLGEFDYAGDSLADLPIFRAARTAYVVAPGRRLTASIRDLDRPASIVARRDFSIGAILQSLRPHQWLKNLLIFVPLITSHRLLELAPMTAAVVALACFCACASAVYVLNDLFDLVADRRHPTKRQRPFASGALPVHLGPPLVLGLALAAFAAAAALLPPSFSAALAVYFFTALAYSLGIKRVVMLDAIVLAGLYTVRVVAGGLATAIPVSEWLMAFSLFTFVSLAFGKRYVELARLAATSESSALGRGYRVDDLSLIESMGPAAGYIAVLVLALYIQSQQVLRLYHAPWALWLLCPLLMYWISRLWVKAKRRELADDPVVFALRDPISLTIAAAALALIAAAAALGR